MDLEEQLNIELKELQTLILAQKYLYRIKASILVKDEELADLAEVVDLEYQDIEKLEKKSLNNLFVNILGDTSQQIEIEKQEYLEAVLRYKDAKRLLKLLNQDAKMLTEQVSKIKEQTLLVESLLIKRERKIEASNMEYKSEFLQCCREIDRAIHRKAEILQAKLAGLKSKQLCQKVITYLSRAAELREWGFGKDGKKMTEEKNNVDRAVEQYYLLKKEIVKFEEELSDIYDDRKEELMKYLLPFNKFKEVYYDFLINDWIVKSRLVKTIDIFKALEKEIIAVYKSVEQKEQRLQDQIDETDAKKYKILNQSANLNY